jgi:hypothetical protein
VKPSIGRIVHYVSYGTPGGEYGKECRAAIVTQVVGPALDPATLQESADSYVVGLCVLNPTGQFFNPSVVQMENPSHDGGTWHWPEREPSEDSVQVKVNTDLSPQQIKSLTAKIQEQLIQQAKRNRRGPGTGA